MIKPRKTLENIVEYQTDDFRIDWRLKLDSNENIYGANQNIISAIKNFDFSELSLYPVYGKTVEKLAKRFDVDFSNILISNGCDEALSVIINAYLDENDEILSYNPTFSMPALYAKLVGAKPKTIKYDEKFVFDIEKFSNNISQNTKLAYIATPNNPTGEIVSRSEIETLLKKHSNTLFIVDCTYINFAPDIVIEDYIDLIKEHENIAIVKSYSKDFAIAGVRFGVVFAQNSIIKQLKKVISPYSVNTLALACVNAVLNDEKSFIETKEKNQQTLNVLSEGLEKLGYKPYPSGANFVLCDFFEHCDFCYEKLKKNGVIVRKFSPNSPISTCLRITVPTLGGVKYILELLQKKNLLIFDLDGVVFDVSNSYTGAIRETFKHFAGQEVSLKEIQAVKNMGGMNCDWDATKCLLEKYGFDIDLEDVINVFQDLFFNPNDKTKKYLIDEEKLVISKEIFEKLSEKFDFAVFSGRLKQEAKYSLEKYDIDKFFYYYVTADDLEKDDLKPSPKGVLKILKHCPHLSVKYFGDSVDDIISGKGANVDTIGIIAPDADYNNMVNNFKHLGAKYILDDARKIEQFLDEIEKVKCKE